MQQALGISTTADEKKVRRIKRRKGKISRDIHGFHFTGEDDSFGVRDVPMCEERRGAVEVGREEKKMKND